MVKLYDKNDNELSKVTKCIPKKVSIKSEKTLLNGQPLVQIIGDPENVYLIECISSYENMVKIQNISATGEKIKVKLEGVTEIGIIKGSTSWSRFNKGPIASRLYKGNFTISILVWGIYEKY